MSYHSITAGLEDEYFSGISASGNDDEDMRVYSVRIEGLVGQQKKKSGVTVSTGGYSGKDDRTIVLESPRHRIEIGRVELFAALAALGTTRVVSDICFSDDDDDAAK